MPSPAVASENVKLRAGYVQRMLSFACLLLSLQLSMNVAFCQDEQSTKAMPSDQTPKPSSSVPGVQTLPANDRVPAGDEVAPGVDLLADSLSQTWDIFSSKEETKLQDVWKVIEVAGERELVCTGTPKGFLLTKQQYDNFEMQFEWKYATDANGNSGVLIFTRKEPRLWPTSMQVQLHQPSSGSIFPSGDASSDNTTEATELALGVGKWNKCRVVARDGKVSVEINGKPAGEVSGCTPAIGSIALQSEGSETHFRRIIVRQLPAPRSTEEATAASKPGGASGRSDQSTESENSDG